MITRRGFLPLLAAPFVVKAASLMPISSAKLIVPADVTVTDYGDSDRLHISWWTIGWHLEAPSEDLLVGETSGAFNLETGEKVHYWGAQIERGRPPNYIPTSGGGIFA